MPYNLKLPSTYNSYFFTRLVRGDGEILEEIVSQARHKEINRTATSGDGASFQAMLNTKLR